MTAVATRVCAALAVLLLLCAAYGGQAKAGGLEPLRIVTATGTHDFQVEIAADERSHEVGLMNRRYMAPDHGMLFEF